MKKTFLAFSLLMLIPGVGYDLTGDFHAAKVYYHFPQSQLPTGADPKFCQEESRFVCGVVADLDKRELAIIDTENKKAVRIKSLAGNCGWFGREAYLWDGGNKITLYPNPLDERSKKNSIFLGGIEESFDSSQVTGPSSLYMSFTVDGLEGSLLSVKKGEIPIRCSKKSVQNLNIWVVVDTRTQQEIAGSNGSCPEISVNKDFTAIIIKGYNIMYNLQSGQTIKLPRFEKDPGHVPEYHFMPGNIHLLVHLRWQGITGTSSEPLKPDKMFILNPYSNGLTPIALPKEILNEGIEVINDISTDDKVMVGLTGVPIDRDKKPASTGDILILKLE